MVFTAILMFYNAEWRYDHGMAVNYCGKKFYTIGPSHSSVEQKNIIFEFPFCFRMSLPPDVCHKLISQGLKIEYKLKNIDSDEHSSLLCSYVVKV